MRLLVTVEHASNRIPAAYGDLGLSRDALESHIAWDPGSRELAQALSKAFAAPLLMGEWSRLLVDLNRSESNRRVIPERTFGVDVPGNHTLPPAQISERIENYWRPFRDKARQKARETTAERGPCLHLSVHTFTPTLGREIRDYDLAVLYDPSRTIEREIAAELVRAWRIAGWAARRNAPYRGVADGHTTALRRELSPTQYAGLEIEVNQRLLPKWPQATAAVVNGMEVAVETQQARL